MPSSISVVIPSYNRRDYLRETLAALRAQTRPADEVIVVDDGSSDGTVEMLAAEHPDIRCLPIANSGDLAARNVGVRAAAGDLVAFCDSDDLWLPEHLAEVAALFEEAPAVGTVCANFHTFTGGRVAAEDKFAHAPPGWFDGAREVGPGRLVVEEPWVRRVVAFNPFFPSAMAMRRAWFLGLGGWDEGVGRTVGTDFATSMRLAEHPPIGFVRRPTVRIRKHESNYSGDLVKMNLGDATILEYCLATRPQLAPLRAEIEASVRRRRLSALGVAFAQRDLATVRAIRAQLGAGPLPKAAAMKAAVAALPGPLGGMVAGALLALGSARARLTGRG
ncbi:MAG: glycosyltransferase [Rubritepida sp.]|jgi:glycosyltransferase involved in cell wall biosynthesis|nr:glycosyltransferase [Rubritepida sp.]